MRKLKLLFAACALLVCAGVQAQKDVTSQYITNATLSDGTNGWTKTFTKNTQTTDPADAFSASTRGNNTVGYATEAYAGWGSLIQTAYSMKQTITLPAGNYRLVNYSFYRQGAAYNTNPEKSLAYLVAGEEKVLIKTLGSITAAGYANSQAEGANVFDSKMYRNVIEFTIAIDNTPIEIGVEGTFDEAKCWCIVGMFELFDLDDLASVSSPTDVTYAITNPGFEYRDLSGWTNTINQGNNTYATNNNFTSKAGTGFYESWKNGAALGTAGSFTQTLTNMPAGLYELSVYAHNVEQYNSNAGGTGMFVIANTDKTEIGSIGQYKVRTTLASDGNLTIGINLDNCTGNWIAFDRFELQFYGDPLAAYQDLLDAAVAEAQAYIDSNPALSTEQIAALQSIVNANDNDDSAFTEESQFSTAIQTIDDAVATYKTLVTPWANFNALKTAANAIAAVAYTETTSSSHTTFADAITAQTTAADNAATVEAINTAIGTLTTAIKTYIAGAEPANDGEYFDITCLMTNPDFEDSHNGWTYLAAPSVSWSNCEYYEKEFDINQTVTGLPTGSYSLSVQAFQRPGWAGDVWTAYSGGTDGASSVLYINSITSNVKNIMADAQDSPKLDKIEGKNYGDWPYDSQVGSDGSYKYIPNSQQGAKLYFDAGLYDATCAAVVDEAANGSLTLGFKSTKTHVSGDWTIFDNFRLYYYGSSLLIYYKQYLPQLQAEASADLSNALYANVTGKEKSDFETALAATPAEETEAAYKAVIDGITDAQTAFRDAATAYDALVAAKTYTALTEITSNIGAGVFQYPSSVSTLWSSYSSAKSAVDDYTVSATSTAAAVQALVDALDDAIEAYEGITLNAPAANTRYNLVVATDSHAKNGNAVVIVPGSTSNNNPTGYGLNANFAINSNLNQAVTFTQVSGNNYNISFETAEGTTYLTYGTTNGSAAGWSDSQIQATTDASKKGEFKIAATTTDNVFNIYNTLTNSTIACQGGGNIYTETGNADFSVSVASQASITINTSAAGYGTLILPFAATLPTDVKAYTCAEVSGDQLTLIEADEVAANQAYIIEGSWNETKTGWGLGTALENKVGLLTGVYAATTAPAGSYVMQKNNNKVGFYKVVDGSQPTVGANRCYVTVPASEGARAAFFFNTEATGIEAIEALTNGEGQIFNASGAQLPKLQKGINIVRKADGKSYKVMVK